MAVAQVAEAERLPKSFLSKIVRGLVKAGIVSARSGTAGGIRLARKPEDITLLEVIEACEGGYARRECVYYADRACPGTDCPVWCDIRRVEEGLMAQLREVTVLRLAESLARHPSRAVV
jgi:Rrf2 family protein